MHPNFKKTSSGYIFRKVVPKPLRGIIGKTEFKVPCGKVYADALARYHIESVKAQQVIDAAKVKLHEESQKLSASRGRFLYPETYLNPITSVTPELVEQLRGLWLSGLEHDLNERAQGLDDEVYDSLAQNIAEMQVLLGRAMARGQIEVILPALHQLLHLRGYVLALRPEEERRLAYDFLTSVMEGYDVLKARHAGLTAPTPTITAVLPEFLPNTVQADDTRSNEGITVGHVIKKFLDDYEKNKVGPAMLKKHLVALPLLGEMVGMRLPVTELRQMHINRYFDEIQRLPSRWPDVCRRYKMSVIELLRNESLLGTKGMAPKTFDDSYRASVSSFLRTAKRNFQDQGFPTTLTTDGIVYTGPREDRENAQRAMRLDELKRMFEGEEMRQIAQDAAKAHQFWLPHIGLFCGARINEVCQINPQVDIHQDGPSGIWYMRITDDTEADANVIKSIKNEVSKRSIPFHPKLIELGLLDYLNSLRKAGATLLFPGFQPKNGRASPEAEVWFRGFIEVLGLRDETPGARLVGYHAFRSTILGEGQELELDFTPITGHAGVVIVDIAGEGQGVRKEADRTIRRYQGEMSVARKMARLERLNFPLNFIKPAKTDVRSIMAQVAVGN